MENPMESTKKVGETINREAMLAKWVNRLQGANRTDRPTTPIIREIAGFLGNATERFGALPAEEQIRRLQTA